MFESKAGAYLRIGPGMLARLGLHNYSNLFGQFVIVNDEETKSNNIDTMAPML
jgi:hypothetical protein